MISVAMTTYNGEKYVIKQLSSIYNQDRKVDEVIICDDCSTDNTINLIRQYIDNNNISNCNLIINKYRKGFVKNFWDCITLTKGDIIFLSDQDDIWNPKKVSIMENIFLTNPNTKVLFSEMNYIDSNDNKIKYNNNHGNGIISNIKHSLSGNTYRVNFKEFIKTGGYQGASIAFRKNVFEQIKKFNIDNKYAHDVFINFYASIINGFYVLKTKLTNYRIHNANTLGIPLTKKRDRVIVLKESITICNELKELLKYCYEHNLINNYDMASKYIDKLNNIYKKRIDNISNKNLFNQLFMITHINLFSSFKTYVGDIKDILLNNNV